MTVVGCVWGLVCVCVAGSAANLAFFSSSVVFFKVK